ncbi:uncharacterized protein LOC135368047 [Ornithodoros turicata]|uniref:uncharacterized protein LOC135368047 n=1 Tax=Ornithodoros turicata TaxID=34597 RepID=UPI003139EE77
MRFAFIIAAFVAGALAGPFEAVDQDSVSLPDFEVVLPGQTARKVNLTEGKVEGLSKFLSPGSDCYGLYKCDVFVSGLRVAYKAVATEPKREFNVVVDVLHGLFHVEGRKTTGGKYNLKNVRVKSLHQYVREPVEFGTDREENAVFDEKLKEKLLEVLEQLTRTDAFNAALVKVFGSDPSKPEPFEVLPNDFVAFPDFELSVSGAPTRNVKFTGGRAEPLSKILKPARGSIGDFTLVLSLEGLRVTYLAVATEPDDRFEVVVDVLQGSVELKRTKTAGTFELKNATVKDLRVYVDKPAKFSNDSKQNTVFEEKLKEKMLLVLKLFGQSEVLVNPPKQTSSALGGTDIRSIDSRAF